MSAVHEAVGQLLLPDLAPLVTDYLTGDGKPSQSNRSRQSTFITPHDRSSNSRFAISAQIFAGAFTLVVWRCVAHTSVIFHAAFNGER